MTIVAQSARRRDHASVEVKRTAIRNRDDLLDRPAIGRSNDCAETADDMLSRGFGGAEAICVRRARGFINRLGSEEHRGCHRSMSSLQADQGCW